MTILLCFYQLAGAQTINDGGITLSVELVSAEIGATNCDGFGDEIRFSVAVRSDDASPYAGIVLSFDGDGFENTTQNVNAVLLNEDFSCNYNVPQYIDIEWFAWEEDICAPDDEYNTGCFDSDDNYTGIINIANVDFRALTGGVPGTAVIPIPSASGVSGENVGDCDSYGINMEVTWAYGNPGIEITDVRQICGTYPNYDVEVDYAIYTNGNTYTFNDPTEGVSTSVTGTTATLATPQTGTVVLSYTSGNAYGINTSFDNLCFSQPIVGPACPVPCPKLSSVAAPTDVCAGDPIALVAAVDSGTENVDYVIEWYENGVAIPGSLSAGADGIPGNADDISSLSYTHTVSDASGACGVDDNQYSAKLYCIREIELDLGDVNSTSTNPADGLGAYFNFTQALTTFDLDLSSLPACALASQFDYAYAFASGGAYGDSWICEGIAQVSTPAPSDNVFCHPDLPGAECLAYPGDGVTDDTCFGTVGAGTGSSNNASSQSLGGVLTSTTPASGLWTVGIYDVYADNGASAEGQINGIYLKVDYFFPPGCSENLAADSDVAAANTTAIYDTPVAGTDFIVPSGCDEELTGVCAGATALYSADGGTTYTLSAPATTGADGEVVYYQVKIAGSPASCEATGSYTITFPPPPTSTTGLEICAGGDVSSGITATCADCVTPAQNTTAGATGSVTYDATNVPFDLPGTSGSCGNSGTATALSFPAIVIPAGAFITSIDYAITGSDYVGNGDDLTLYEGGAVVATQGCAPPPGDDGGNINFTGTYTGTITTDACGTNNGSSIAIPSFTIDDGYDDVAGGDSQITAAQIVVNYQEAPVGTCDPGGTSIATVNWYDLEIGGTQQGAGATWTPTGNAEEGAFSAATPGTYTFYAECECDGCPSSRVPAIVEVYSQPTLTPGATSCDMDCVGSWSVDVAVDLGANPLASYDVTTSAGSVSPLTISANGTVSVTGVPAGNSATVRLVPTGFTPDDANSLLCEQSATIQDPQCAICPTTVGTFDGSEDQCADAVTAPALPDAGTIAATLDDASLATPTWRLVNTAPGDDCTATTETYTLDIICSESNAGSCDLTDVATYTVDTYPVITVSTLYPEDPLQCKVEIVMSCPGFDVSWTSSDQAFGAASGDQNSASMTATATGYIWDAEVAYNGVAALGTINFVVTNPNATGLGACTSATTGDVDYLCCIANAPDAEATSNLEVCEGSSVSYAFVPGSQDPITEGLVGTIYENAFLLAENGVVVDQNDTGVFAPAVGCYEVYGYNYNVFTGTPAADLVGGPVPTAADHVPATANCAAISTAPFSLFVYPQLAVTLTTSDYNGFGVSCNIGIDTCPDILTCTSDGFIEANVTGGTGDPAADCGLGTGDYTIEWSQGGGVIATSVVPFGTPTDVLPDLPSGIYTATIFDPFADGCAASATIQVTQPLNITCDALVSDVSCPPGTTLAGVTLPDGEIGLVINGGVTALGYTVNLSDAAGAPLGSAAATAGSNNPLFTGLAAGDYTVEAIDANGCGCSETLTITEPEPFDALGGSANANEGFSGNVLPVYYNYHELSISGGTPPYNFDFDRTGYVRWDASASDDPAYNTDLQIIYADGAEWSVTVTDANGCTLDPDLVFTNDDGTGDGNSVNTTGTILDIDNVVITGETYNSYTAGSQTGDGTIDITMAGCNGGPYVYNWSGPGTPGVDYCVSCEDQTGLESGHYEVTVTCGGQTTEGFYYVPLDRRSGRLKAGIQLGMDIYPNPATDHSFVDITLAEASDVTLTIFSADGKEVSRTDLGMISSNQTFQYRIDSKALGLVPGLYQVMISTATSTAAQSMIITE